MFNSLQTDLQQAGYHAGCLPNPWSEQVTVENKVTLCAEPAPFAEFALQESTTVANPAYHRKPNETGM
jgi:hypothetical protein